MGTKLGGAGRPQLGGTGGATLKRHSVSHPEAGTPVPGDGEQLNSD